MTNPAGSFIWYELMTPDPSAAATFYGDVVGWQIDAAPAAGAGGMDYRMISRDDGGQAGGVLKLSSDMAEHGATPVWLGYIYVPDVDAAVDAMLADGAKVQMHATDLPVGRIAMVSDPWGAPFYLMKPVPPPGKEEQASDVYAGMKPQHVCWNDYETTDLDGALRFYNKHFGWTFDDAMDMGPGGKYHFISHAGLAIGGMLKSPQGKAMWSYYIRTPGTAKAAESAVVARGGTVTLPIHEVPGGDHVFKALDPQGALVGFVGKAGD